MATIEYGIDGYGRKVLAKDGQHNRTYICPICHKGLDIRREKNPFFAHKRISNRTLEERACPWYKGNGTNDKIEGEVDRVYIYNGGIPLYLNLMKKGRYELKAHFPPLRQSNMHKMEEWGVKVCIKEDGFDEIIHNIQNVKYHQVKTLGARIRVNCIHMKQSISEVSQKWEWGIRGLNIYKDIFHSNYCGGYRVALNSNISVDKKYLIVSEKGSRLSIEGIDFKKTGILNLRKFGQICEFQIYSMRVRSITEETIKYIQKKGYKLIEQSDELIPMWPPAVIEGKELIYRKNSDNAYLYHKNISGQKLFFIDSGIRNISENGEIITVDSDNKTLLLSDYKFNCFSTSEIRYILTRSRDNFKNYKLFEPKVMCNDGNDKYNVLKVNNSDIFKAKKIFFDADFPIKIDVLKGYYLEFSSKRRLESIKRNRKLIIDLGAFGKKWIENNNSELLVDTDIDLNSIVEILYNCNSAFIPLPRNYLKYLDYAKQNSIDLYKIMFKWKMNKKMPYKAITVLQNIKEVIGE